jgi:Family of unknown function (DUF6056)
MILPFAILFFFNHPSADDWIMSEYNKIYGFQDMQVYYYKYMSGRYFTNAILSYSPLYFKSLFGYKMLTLLLMLLFIYILFALISGLTKSTLNFKERFLLTLSIFFLYLYAMPSLSQSFYWLTASIGYQCGIMLVMIFLILYAKMTKPGESSSDILLTFLSVLLLIAIAGCTEMSMVLSVFMVSLLVICYLVNKRRINVRLILFTAIVVLCTYIVVSSPSNSVRRMGYPDSHKLLPAISITFSTLFDYFVSWIFMSPLLFITLLLVPVLFKLIKNSGKKPVTMFVNPVYTIITFLVILFILFFTPIWSLGRSPFNRTVNLIYFAFLIGWFYNVIVIMYYLFKKYNFNIERMPKYIYTAAFIIVVLFLFKKNNVKNAYVDLLRGGVVKYNNELNERYDLISKRSSDSLTVPELKNIPRTIFVFDITNDPKSKLDRMYAHYFNKRVISVANSDTLTEK